MRSSRIMVLGFAGSAAGCFGGWAAPMPASPASLACSLNELTRLGYLISAPEGGSGWQQAYRERGGGGDEIWIRLVDDGRHAPWLDLRASTWNQFPPAPQPNGDTRPFLFRSGQVQEDVRTVRDACEESEGLARQGISSRTRLAPEGASFLRPPPIRQPSLPP